MCTVSYYAGFFFFFLFPLLSEFNTPHFIAVFLFSDYLPYLDGDGSGLADYMQLGIWVWDLIGLGGICMGT